MKFNRQDWSNIKISNHIDINKLDLDKIVSLNDRLSTQDIYDIYIPLTMYLSEKVRKEKEFFTYVQKKILNKTSSNPYIIGISGGVSVGKSTVARLFLELLNLYNPDWNIELITTDGYIYPKEILLRKGIMTKKGFPESYETGTLIRDLKRIKEGEENVPTYTYSHLTYDRISNEYYYVNQPDILIIEGVNIFQTNDFSEELVSDYLDYKIYLDAELEQMKKWYIERFFKLQMEAFQNPKSHFYQYRNLDKDKTKELAAEIWHSINEVNINENIKPTKKRADLVLHKSSNHEIDYLDFNKF
jgi:type I pantothenate kinase